MRPSNIIELIQERAATQPERLAYRLLRSDGTESSAVHYGELYRRICLVAAFLEVNGMANRQVILLYPTGLEFIYAFFGCLYARAVAVPIAPPRSRPNAERVRAVMKDCDAALVLTTEELLPRVSQLLEDLSLGSVPVDAPIGNGVNETPAEPFIQEDTLALLQYTSGSTGDPKGVMISHGNLWGNARRMNEVFRHTTDSICVSWLPLFHDMGLTGGVVQPLYGAFPCTLMDPGTFIHRPFRWLSAISESRATISGGPNFAYEMCARSVPAEERASLDLSCWRTAFNGSEPVRMETLESFAVAFSGSGFRRDSFYPCYGLAEATLLVSGGRLSAASSAAQVSCGSYNSGLEVVIVDPKTRVLKPTAETGEIWVAGDSVALGYWNRPAETTDMFHATLDDTSPNKHFLRTGDLGYIDGGQLYINGRMKDIVIIRGQNYYPEDIEIAAQRSDRRLVPSRGAAFSVDGVYGERLVIVQEMEEAGRAEASAITRVIRGAVAAEMSLSPAEILLVRRGALPKTSSGKVRRLECRRQFLASIIEPIYRDSLANTPEPGEPVLIDVEALKSLPPEARQARIQWYVHLLASTCMHVDAARINPFEPLIHHGLDSLSAAQLAGRIEGELGVELSPAALLNRLTVAQAAAEIGRLWNSDRPRELTSVPSRDLAGGYPSTAQQRRLYAMAALAADDPAYELPAYNLGACIEFRGVLQTSALLDALNEVVARHEMLRTRFEADRSGEIVQMVDPPAWQSLELEYATDRSSVEQIAAGETRRRFDFSKAPLLRVRLWRIEVERHWLMVVVPHIVADGWSANVFLRDLAAAYTTSLMVLVESHPLSVRRFGEYAISRKLAEAAPEYRAHLDYWSRQLKGAKPLDLPRDRSRTTVSRFHGERHHLTVGAELYGRIKRLGTEQDATPFMVMCAALHVLLGSYSGQTDIVTGVVVANRNRPRVADIIGYLADAIGLRSSLAGNPTFREFLAQVRQTALEAYEHQEAAYDDVVKSLQRDETFGRNPIFNVVLTLQESPLANVHFSGLDISWNELHDGSALFDLAIVVCSETDGALRLRWEYNSDLYDQSSIRRMATNFLTLLGGIAATPEERVQRLPRSSAMERGLLSEWNRTEQDLGHAPILQQFKSAAARCSHAIALVSDESRASYGELDQRSDILAQVLLSRGVRPEEPVGVALPRSIETIVALLAIIKAGAVYLPIPPSYPRERRVFQLAHSGARILLTTAEFQPQLSDMGGEILLIDAEHNKVASSTPELPVHQDSSVLYLLYTSGSTGAPKAVLGTHGGTLNRLRWMWNAFPFGANEVVCQKTSLGFVDSIWECLGGLLAGVPTVIAPDSAVSNIDTLVTLLRENRVTRIVLVPSLLSSLLNAYPNLGELLPSLKLWISSGERLPAYVVSAFSDALPSATLLNLYGSTEIAADVTFCPGGASLGRPLPNVTIHIIDRDFNTVPIGAAGEIYIGGIALARGYHRAPDLTAERFLPNPFSPIPGQRMYRTGDMGRYLSGGDIEYLGRADQQIKIRGHRIEPGEVEAALLSHPDVRHAVVATRNGGQGHEALTAYVLPRSRLSIAPSELNAFLRERLPSYMLPSMYIPVETIPMLPNGKVDHGSLAALLDPEPPVRTHQGPSALADTVIRIWREVLNRDDFGPDDNFFEVGGHSLALVQVRALIKEELSIPIPIADLFQHPTLSSLIRRLVEQSPEGDIADMARERALAQMQSIQRQRQIRQTAAH